MNVIRIPTKFSRSIERLSDKDRLSLFDSLLKIGKDELINVPDSAVGDIITLVYGEWMNMESRNGTKPSINHISEGLGTKSPGDSEHRVEYNRVEESRAEESKFDIFYSFYPKKINRKNANAKYESVIKKGTPHDTVIEGLKKWNRKWENEKTELKFIPAPDVWLNRENWNDEIEAEKPKSRLEEARKILDASLAISHN